MSQSSVKIELNLLKLNERGGRSALRRRRLAVLRVLVALTREREGGSKKVIKFLE